MNKHFSKNLALRLALLCFVSAFALATIAVGYWHQTNTKLQNSETSAIQYATRPELNAFLLNMTNALNDRDTSAYASLFSAALPAESVANTVQTTFSALPEDWSCKLELISFKFDKLALVVQVKYTTYVGDTYTDTNKQLNLVREASKWKLSKL